MEVKFHRIALGVIAAVVLLLAASRSLRAEDSFVGSSAVPPSTDSPTAAAANTPGTSDPTAGDQAPAAQSDPASAGSGSTERSGNAVVATTQKGFWARLAQAYYDDWHPPAGSTVDAPKYRGDPMPESNPPYPFNVWPIGGTVWIGYPNATNYPLTTALYGSQHWQWLKKSNIQIYGWANAGMNLSTSTESQGGKYANAPAATSCNPARMAFLPFSSSTYISSP